MYYGKVRLPESDLGSFTMIIVGPKLFVFIINDIDSSVVNSFLKFAVNTCTRGGIMNIPRTTTFYI